MLKNMLGVYLVAVRPVADIKINMYAFTYRYAVNRFMLQQCYRTSKLCGTIWYYGSTRSLFS